MACPKTYRSIMDLIERIHAALQDTPETERARARPTHLRTRQPPPQLASDCPQVSLQRNARVTTERKARVWDADGTLEVASWKSTP